MFVFICGSYRRIYLIPRKTPYVKSIHSQPRVTSFMWSSRLRTPLTGLVAAPGRAFASSFTRGRRSPRVARDVARRLRPVAHNRGALSPQQFEPTATESNRPTPNYDPTQNTLLSPVHIPEDPNGVLKETHPAMGILANSGLVIQRQLELMNVMMYAALWEVMSKSKLTSDSQRVRTGEQIRHHGCKWKPYRIYGRTRERHGKYDGETVVSNTPKFCDARV